MQPSYAVRNLVLVGRTDNGKSATGNSILMGRAFRSNFSSIGVTRTSQMETAELEDGMTLNVIDTPDAVRTLVLVGKTGNGKSATGNSILQRKAFKSFCSFEGVTRASQMETAKLEDGLSLNVIDTPGFFDPSVKPDFITKEIVKCVRMAEDGIHAFLIVLSVKNRFSFEERKTFDSLKELFGDKVVDYAIIVFTNGDELEESDETLDDYLNRNSTGPLKEVIQMCGNRCVLFNNKTKDKYEKNEQLRKLLSLVNKVVDENDGKPYTNELFVQFKVEKEIAGRMAEAEAESKRKLAEAQTESEKRMAEAQAESERRLVEAEAQAESKIRLTEALAESKIRLAEAQAESKIRLVEAQAESNRRLAEAQAEFNRRLAEAQAESERKIRELHEKIERLMGTPRFPPLIPRPPCPIL